MEDTQEAAHPSVTLLRDPSPSAFSSLVMISTGRSTQKPFLKERGENIPKEEENLP